jgi:hypothetical protein
MKKFKIFRIGLMLCLPLVLSCEADDAQGPEDYFDQGDFIIELDAQKSPGKGQYRTVLQSDETLTVSVHVKTDQDLESLKIKKTVNLEVDESFGNGGTLEVQASGSSFDYQFAYEPTVADVDELVGFTFTAVTDAGKTQTSDLTTVVTLSPLDNLVTKKWVWTSIKHVNEDNEEVINDCEKDNAFLFNADGTMSIDYGAITGTGNCGFDGLTPYANWHITEDGEFFVMEKYNVFTPDIIQEERYEIVTLSVDQLQLSLEIDLTVLGLGIETFLYTFKPEPKD